MKNAKLYDVGEEVMIKGTIVDRQFEGANIKYKVKDLKSAKTLDWYYTDKDLIPVVKKPQNTTSN